jgi:hypothetical protein
MQRSGVIGGLMVFVVTAGLTGSVFAEPETVEDFYGDDLAWSVHDGEARGGAVNLSAAPRRARRAMRLRWEPEHANYLGVNATPAIPIETFAEASEGVIVAEVYSPGTPGADQVNLRLEDDKGETFQWRTLRSARMRRSFSSKTMRKRRLGST